MRSPDNSSSSKLPRVLLVGASTRAAAFSARRAGFEPICVDMFGDADLQSIAEVIPVRQYPDGLIEAAAGVDPAIPWLYTGGLENHPETVAAISSQRPLWGNNAAVLRLVRDPLWLRDILSRAGLPALDVVAPKPNCDDGRPPPDGSWIAKPLRRAGGRGVCIWNAAAEQSPSLDEPHYFQQRAEGDSIGTLFLASHGRTQLLGITRQLVGLVELGAIPFAYCGSIGPISMNERIETIIRRVGNTVGQAASMRGLFGCDFVFDGQTPWLVEVNPRYTASAEILELASGTPLLEWHCWACSKCTGERTSEPLAPHLPPKTLSPCGGEGNMSHSALIGKAILYADRELVAPHWSTRMATTTPSLVPFLADIPTAGSSSPAGWPLCTVFATGGNSDDVLAKLIRRAIRVRGRFLESEAIAS
ncbi:MAG: ATP-grasp domain-containing protein [Planctomycetales bacterium]|nr:ATP-grasp domain-containing protein [Planctomycetales bacterium]